MNEELLISGLKPFTRYTISVVAIGMSGLVSPRSEEVQERTNSTVPPVINLPTNDRNPDTTVNTITISLPPANFSTGPLV